VRTEIAVILILALVGVCGLWAWSTYVGFLPMLTTDCVLFSQHLDNHPDIIFEEWSPEEGTAQPSTERRRGRLDGYFHTFDFGQERSAGETPGPVSLDSGSVACTAQGSRIVMVTGLGSFVYALLTYAVVRAIGIARRNRNARKESRS
jgi:hypothetical protein